MKIVKYLIICVMIGILFISKIIYAKEITNEDELSALTVSDAINYADGGNVFKILKDYEENNERIGEEIYFGREMTDEEREEHNKFVEEKDKIYEEIKLNIEKNSSVKDNLYKYIKANKLKIIIIISILALIILLCVLCQNKIIKAIIVFVYIVIFFIFIVADFNRLNNYNKHLINYLNGIEKIDNKYIIDDTNIEKKKLENEKWNISHIINDYLLKVYRCVKSKATGEKLKILDSNCDGSRDLLYFVDDEYYIEYDDGAYLNEDIEQVFTDDTERWEVGIRVGFIDRDDIKCIYNNITDEDVEDYNNGIFLEKLVEKLEKIIKTKEPKEYKEELLFDYIRRINNYNILISYNNTDELRRNIRYWYIDGDDKMINLPYGVKLYYEKPYLERRDIKEFYNSNIFDIVVGKKETDLIVYYVDGTDKKDANITKIKYGNNKVVFNSDEFLYKIARGRAGLTSNDEMDWEKEAKRKQKEEEERELKKKIMQETDWTEGGTKSIMPNRKTADLISQSYFNSNHGKFWKDSSYSKEFVEKYKENKSGIFNNFEVKSGTGIYIKNEVRKENKDIRKLVLRGDDESSLICIFKVIWNDKNEVDDILTYIVPEDKTNLTYEEMYQLAFND